MRVLVLSTWFPYPYTIVGGVPARPIGQRRQDLDYTLDYRKFLG